MKIRSSKYIILHRVALNHRVSLICVAYVSVLLSHFRNDLITLFCRSSTGHYEKHTSHRSFQKILPTAHFDHKE